MDYTKLVTRKKQYKYSVNICFDLRDEERIAGFIPNTTTTEIIREYLGGIFLGILIQKEKALRGLLSFLKTMIRNLLQIYANMLEKKSLIW